MIDAGRSKKGRLAHGLLILLLAVYALAVLADLMLHRQDYQLDFRTYYFAGKAFAEGLNPYDLTDLSQVAGYDIGFPFAYSPITLPLFQLLSLVDLATASYLYLILKLVALGGLLVLWTRAFLKGEPDPLFYIFCLIGFGGAVYIDLSSGNITVFEQLGLWLAFYAVLRRRALAFCLLLLAVSLFKLYPILFLVLLGLTKVPGRKRYFAGALAAFVGLQMVSYWKWPHLFVDFLTLAQRLDERGLRNPTSLSLVRDAAAFLDHRGIVTLPPYFQTALYLVAAVVVVVVTWRVAKRVVDGESRSALYLVCIASALVLPRFKDYSYMLVLLPAYALAKTEIRVQAHSLMVVLLMLSGTPQVPFGLDGTARAIVWGYYPLLSAFAVWALAASSMLHKAEGQPRSVLQPPAGSMSGGPGEVSRKGNC